MECLQDALPGRSHCRDHLVPPRRRLRVCICGAVNCTRHGPKPIGSSGWAKYVQDRPEMAGFYQSASWRAARDRHLAANPTCVVCGAKATIVDHIRSRAEGGAGLDPSNFQSMCKRCHKAKTIDESHRGRKRAAEERRRGRP